MFRVKVCGITRQEDAFEAVRLGFDALGFIFAPGPRKVDPDLAKAIIERLPPLVTAVGVFVHEEPSMVRRIIDHCGLDLVQFHGPQPPELCARFMPRSIKSIHLADRKSLELADTYVGSVRALHFDTHSAGGGGGTGLTCDWALARQSVRRGVRVIIAGGLGPENAKDAIREADPWAIDVNSGVEKSPGVKCHDLMRALATILKTCERNVI